MHIHRTNAYNFIFLIWSVISTRTFAFSDTPASLIVLAKGNGLSLFNLSSNAAVDLLFDDSNPYRVDSLIRNDGNVQLFWSDMEHNTIRSAILANESLLNSSNLFGLKDAGTVEDLAVDWVSGNVYWIVNPFGRIDVIRVDGKHHSIVIDGLVQPRALAVDSLAGLMFWSDYNNNFVLERSTVAGGDRRVVVRGNSYSRDKQWVNAIALDHEQQNIYWVDASSHSIRVASYDGLNSHLLIEDDHYLSLPYSLTLSSNKLLWSDGKLRSVFELNLENTSSIAVAHESTQLIFDVSTLHGDPESRVISHICLKGNDGCSHLCLRDGPANFKCVCPFGMELSEDERTCLSSSTVLIIVAKVSYKQESNPIPVIFRQNALRPTKSVFPPLKLNKKADVRCIAYDDSINLLVWYDAFDSKLYYQKGIKEGSFLVSHDSTSVAIENLAEDKIYVASGGQNPCISVCDINTHVCVPEVIDRIWSPSHMFVVNSNLVWLDNNNGTKVVQSYSPTSEKRRELVSGPDICCLTVDPITRDLFWMNKGKPIKYLFNSDRVITLHKMLPGKQFEIVAAGNGFLYSNYTFAGNVLKSSHVDNEEEEWISVEVGASFDAVSVVTTAALMPKPVSLFTEKVKWSNGRRRTIKKLEQIKFELTTLATLDGVCKCLRGVCDLNCTCIIGYNGCLLTNEALEPCSGYCVHGNCSPNFESDLKCICQSGWVGSRCNIRRDSIKHVPVCANEDETSDDFRKLNLNFHLLIFIFVASVFCLTVICFVLFVLWMRTKRVLAMVMNADAVSTTGSETSNDFGQVKLPRWSDYFVPHMNPLKRNLGDDCCLLNHQKVPALTNTHV